MLTPFQSLILRYIVHIDIAGQDLEVCCIPHSLLPAAIFLALHAAAPANSRDKLQQEECPAVCIRNVSMADEIPILHLINRSSLILGAQVRRLNLIDNRKRLVK